MVGEPMRQAEREVVYAIYGFERFKRAFAVQLASEYYTVLQLRHEADNELENYRWLIDATRRARRMAGAQRLDEIQLDQTAQDELEARDAWVPARSSSSRRRRSGSRWRTGSTCALRSGACSTRSARWRSRPTACART